MSSTSDRTAAAAAEDAVKESTVDTTPSSIEATHDKEATTEEPESVQKAEDEQKAVTSSSAVEQLVENADKLNLNNKGEEAVKEAEDETTNPATDIAESEQTVQDESIAPEEKAESKIGAQDEAEDELIPVSSEQAPPKTETPATTAAANAIDTEEPKVKEESNDNHSEVLTASTTQPETIAELSSTIADEPTAATTTSAEQANNIGKTSAADESMAPPTPPSKDTPKPIEKTSQAVALPSTPTQQRSTRTDREALADPDSVAAVAHAFGRDSPALRSSTDTPIRVSTPLAIDKDAAPAPVEKEKLESGLNNIAEGSSKSTSTQPSHPSEGSSTQEHGSTSTSEKSGINDNDKETSRGGIRIGKGPPPQTQASEELPFDFNRFLEQMKHRSAQPVGEYVRSFIKGFAKKPYRTQDQIKLIFDFLDFIAARMRECDIWKNLSESDFENAKEAMEKLVMNRLYPYTFTPAVQKEGRFAVQTDDLERDRVLRQRIGLFGWLSEEHLDVPVGDHSRGFVEFSIQELLKINHYKAPRDKLICILNCCKVIFGMIRHLSSQENADTFIPVLIFVVLKANPEHLISNVEYISRFRNPDRLSSEAGYYLSSLMGAIAFIETMDYTSLSNITQEEFEKRVEDAVASMPEQSDNSAAAAAGAGLGETSVSSLLAPPITPPPRSSSSSPFGNAQHQRSVSATSVSAPSGSGEEAAKALPFTPMAATLADDTRAFFLRTGEAARTGLSRPMGALGRLINEGIEGIRTPSSNDNSGASTERQNSPAPSANAAGGSTTGMTTSTSRSKFLGGLFGSLERPDNAARQAGYPGQQGTGRRSVVMVDDEPQTPSTGDLLQDGFQPYPGGGAPNAPARGLLRPNMPQRNYSIDDTMFDDESASRRNLMATNTASGGGADQRGQQDYYDSENDDDDYDRNAGGLDSTPNASQEERQRQRRQQQMQQDFGYSPSPRSPAAHRQRASRGEVEAAQTEQAIHQSLVDLDQESRINAAQNSASVETLKSIFPTMDEGVIGMVLQGCEGNVETAIDRLLEMQ